mgnify:CR=1 FL=1
MADVIRRVQIIFDSNAEEILRRLRQAADEAAGGSTRLAAAVKITAGAVAAMGGAAALVAVAVDRAFTSLGPFEQAMKNVQAASGATAAELAQLSEAALDFSKNSRFAPKEAAEGLYALAGAGLSANQQISVLPQTLGLAEAAQADLGQSTELVLGAMANFNIAAADAARVADVFTASINVSSFNADRLSVAMRNAGPAAAAARQSFEGTVAALSILVKSFNNGELAGTGLKSALGILATKAQKLGLDIKDSSGQMKSLPDLLDVLTKKGITASNAIELFGTEAGPALAILLTAGSKGLKEMEAAVQANGQAAKAAAVQIDTLEGSQAKLKNSIEVFWIRLGQAISGSQRDLYATIAQLVQQATQWIQSHAAEIGRAWQAVTSLAGAALRGLVTIIEFVAENLSALKAVVIAVGIAFAGWQIGVATAALAAFTAGATLADVAALGLIGAIEGLEAIMIAASGAFRALTAAMLANPIGLIAVALAGIVYATQRWIDKTREAWELELKRTASGQSYALFLDDLRNRTELLTEAEAAHGKQLLENLAIEAQAARATAERLKAADVAKGRQQQTALFGGVLDQNVPLSQETKDAIGFAKSLEQAQTQMETRLRALGGLSDETITVVASAASSGVDAFKKLDNGAAAAAERIRELVRAAEIAARQAQQEAAVATSSLAVRNKLAVQIEVENVLRSSGLKLTDLQIAALVQEQKTTNELANRLAEATRQRVLAKQAEEEALDTQKKRADLSEQLAAEIKKLTEAQTGGVKSVTELSIATKLQADLDTITLQALEAGLPLWDATITRLRLAALATAALSNEQRKVDADAAAAGAFGDSAFADVVAFDEDLQRTMEENSKATTERIAQNYEQMWGGIAAIGLNVFDTWASGGKVTFRDVAQQFLRLWEQAFAEWLQKWISKLAAAKAAEQVANLGSASGSSQGGGNVAGLAGAGTSAGLSASVVGVLGAAAVIGAIYILGDAYVKRARARSFGSSGDIGISGGKFKGLDLTEGAEVSNSIINLIKQFQNITGSVVTEMDKLGIKIRNDGKSFQVLVNDRVLTTFATFDEAVINALQIGLRNAKIDNLAPAIAQFLKNANFQSAKEFEDALKTVQDVLDFDLTDVERGLRDFSLGIDDLIEKFTRWGVSTQEIAELAEISAQRWRDRITGIKKTDDELRELDRQAYNRWVMQEKRRVLEEIERLKKLAGGGGGGGGGTGGGVAGDSGGNAGGDAGGGGGVTTAAASADRSLGRVGNALLQFNRQIITTAATVSIASAAASGATTDLQKEIDAWLQYLNSLKEITPEEIKPTGGKGGRGGGGGGDERRQAEDEFRSRMNDLRAGSMTDAARGLFELNLNLKEFVEQAAKAKASAAERAEGERLLREQYGKTLRDVIRPYTADYGKTDFERNLAEERRKIAEQQAIPRGQRIKAGGPADWELARAAANLAEQFARTLEGSIDAFRGFEAGAAGVARQAEELRRNVLALGGSAEDVARRLAEISLGEAFQIQQGQLGVLDRLFGYLKGSEKHAKEIAAHEKSKIALEFTILEAQLKAWNIWNDTTKGLLADARTAAEAGLTDGSGGGGGFDRPNSFDAREERRNEAARIFEEAVARFKESTDRLIEAQGAFRLDDSTTYLSPREQVAEARRQLDDVVTRARAGDIDARNSFVQSYQAYLREYAGTFGRGGGFADESRRIDAILTELIAQTRFIVGNVAYDTRLGGGGTPQNQVPASVYQATSAPAASSTGGATESTMQRVASLLQNAGGEIALFRQGQSQSSARNEQRLTDIEAAVKDIQIHLRLERAAS